MRNISIIVFILNLFLFCSCGKVASYPREVDKPTPFEALNGLLIPYSGYTALKYDQTVVFIDIDPVDNWGEVNARIVVLFHNGETVEVLQDERHSLDTKAGGLDTVRLPKGIEIEFIDTNMIVNSGFEGAYFAENLPNVVSPKKDYTGQP